MFTIIFTTIFFAVYISYIGSKKITYQQHIYFEVWVHSSQAIENIVLFSTNISSYPMPL